MHVTVGICTWNRADLLDQTLTQMRGLRIPAGVSWELLVVNNNCTDHTDEVIARHVQALPICRVFEPRQGLSNARNRAIDEASGELILWTDDDVLVDPGWLAAYVAAAERWPDAVFFGGEILPWYEESPPAWLVDNLDHFQSMLLIRSLDDVERELAPGDSPFRLPFGANMAFRMGVLGQHRFDPSLGSIGEMKVFGEETFVMAALMDSGLQGVWVPSAKVKHYITPARASIKYMKYFYYWLGRSTGSREERHPELPMIRGVPRYLYRRYIGLLGRSIAARVFRRRDRFQLIAQASRDRGWIDAYALSSKASRT